MHWTFKDRYQPHLTLNVDYDMPETLKQLGTTIDEFKAYEKLEGEKAERFLNRSENFTILMIHIALSSVYAVYDENYLFDYSAYVERIRKNLIDVHPAFAAKAFADCFCKIRYEQSILTNCNDELDEGFVFTEKE
ncbi:hypothetical protein ALQ37_200012 [Pseudomonas syringae pv. aptata]|uniref:Uncharacterized protein n=1 Tax=Pseudomonas syringae pv. aptata TaxID=83167 RepID=A0A0Q0DJ46_PSEAP|nr:hypothetical protein [Pseudomonas syringae]KPY98030.1 Unknown protein sequence [Pseudomonas syringae pv. aptata]RMO65465.1 hypothetical protein ALQ37_200012 [Pseudomonas syringae pv. aptata]